MLLALLYLAALGWCSVYVSVWLYHPTAREEELTAGLLGVTVQRFL